MTGFVSHINVAMFITVGVLALMVGIPILVLLTRYFVEGGL